MQRAIFLDRDGVINRRRINDYVKSWEEFEFLPDIFRGLPGMHERGYLVIVVTNQRGIARGLMSEVDVVEIHRLMNNELYDKTSERVDRVYVCPHDIADKCDCRKPKPGMLLEAARDYDLDLSACWLIGDSESDIQAGLAAGVSTARIASEAVETEADVRGTSLEGAWRAILSIIDEPEQD